MGFDADSLLLHRAEYPAQLLSGQIVDAKFGWLRHRVDAHIATHVLTEQAKIPELEPILAHEAKGQGQVCFPRQSVFAKVLENSHLVIIVRVDSYALHRLFGRAVEGYGKAHRKRVHHMLDSVIVLRAVGGNVAGCFQAVGDHHVPDLVVLGDQERLTTKKLRTAQVRQILAKRRDESRRVADAMGRKLLAMGADRGGPASGAHNAFQVARIADGEFHPLRPFGHGPRNSELVEIAHRGSCDPAIGGLLVAQIAARSELHSFECLAQYLNPRAAPDFVDAVVQRITKRVFPVPTARPNVPILRKEEIGVGSVTQRLHRFVCDTPALVELRQCFGIHVEHAF